LTRRSTVQPSNSKETSTLVSIVCEIQGSILPTVLFVWVKILPAGHEATKQASWPLHVVSKQGIGLPESEPSTPTPNGGHGAIVMTREVGLVCFGCWKAAMAGATREAPRRDAQPWLEEEKKETFKLPPPVGWLKRLRVGKAILCSRRTPLLSASLTRLPFLEFAAKPGSVRSLLWEPKKLWRVNTMLRASAVSIRPPAGNVLMGHFAHVARSVFGRFFHCRGQIRCWHPAHSNLWR
jgi:hypothetical protein